MEGETGSRFCLLFYLFPANDAMSPDSPELAGKVER